MNFKKILIFTAIFVSLFLFKISSSYASGGMNGYMTNLLSDIQSLSPTAYSGQQRGFFVGGSMEIPPQGETIQPFSITLPHLSFNGCGGIDLTAGGLSYLNFKYLVQKLQGILQAAPAFAFEIGLKILSEQAGGVMNDLEAATNAINDLNLNSCQAMNKIVGAIMPTASQTKDVQEKQASTNAQATGGSSWLGGALDKIGSDVSGAWSNFVSNFTSGATGSSGAANQANPLVSFGLPSNTSVLHNAGLNIQSGFPNLIPTIRYFVGDVVPNPNSSGNVSARTIYEPPCGSYSFKDYSGITKDIVEAGNLPMANIGGVPANFCSNSQSNSFAPLVQQVSADIQNIYIDMQANSSTGLTTNDINLINSSPIPVLAFLRVASLSNNPAVVQELSTTMAKTISYGIVYNLINQVTGMVIEGIDDNQIQIDTSGTSTSAPTKAETKKLIKQLDTFDYAANHEYMKHLRETELIYGDFLQQYSQDEQVVQADLQKDHIMSVFDFDQTIAQEN